MQNQRNSPKVTKNQFLRNLQLEHQITNDKRRFTDKHRGKKTKRAIKNFDLELKRDRMEELRWSSAAMTLGLRKSLGL